MIKGYDAQLMVHKAMDAVRDANTVQRRNDTAQSLLVDQQREKIEREQESVLYLEETQGSKIRPDEDNRRREKPQQQKRRASEAQQAEDETDEPKVFPVHNRFDIRI